MKIKVLILATTLLFAAPTFAQTPSDESLNKMMSLMNIEQSLKDMEAGMPTAIEQMLQHSLDQDPDLKKLPAHKAQKIKAIVQKYVNEAAQESMGNALIRAAMFESFLKIAKRHYTQAEVDAMNAFLSTPEGASMTQKQGKVMAEFMPDFMQTVAPIQDKILREKLALAHQEIETVIGKPKAAKKKK
ncbi:DUF2059 domain-containing protein [Alysiella crassa]|uniref:Uncharacterized protein conserved in bacteria n=1 Tax=Alysiella crassa TaxID=153491 RepID=A0A376BW85_9NEIS|nr:DUF2059 domain-containing protein [Alysiella crassa]UOP06567.1 DUF2059 domain-containing protein [Alysiella crassa]SSY81101.1 Uncharacterized protein conserved in bacteria [Alysiella crassa]